ncbi:MAG: flippase-like domain-containing protein [Acidobacteria bacterium]|nr:flippase-like domain-containing protein [Acidobacteriota bacterium]MCI0627972.1 flippase-like domain-containing protein [Acidobacteriota bacterium]MCI0719874.1 flippase-like domain-containing protein [Acidobacteriota bacterium]
MKRLFQLGISLALSVLVGYLIYRGVPDWGRAWRVMIQGRPQFLLAGFAFVMLHMVLRAVRWGVLLSPVKRGISLKNLFSLTLIKYTVNIIPPRAGEVAASLLLAGKERVSAASVIAGSLLERILDMMTVVVIFGFYMAFFSHWYAPSSERGQTIMLAIQSYSLKGFIVLCLGFVVLAFLLRSNQWQNRLPGRLRNILLPFLDGFRGLQQGGVLFQAVVLSIAIWLVITVQLWCFMHAYLDEFPFVGSLFLMAITVVGVAIPTPGGAGGFQFFMDLALVNFFARYLSTADPQSQAAGISNGSYLVSMIPVILIGLFFLNREGLSFGSVSRLAAQKPL